MPLGKEACNLYKAITDKTKKNQIFFFFVLQSENARLYFYSSPDALNIYISTKILIISDW